MTGQKVVANGVVHCSGRSGPGQLICMRVPLAVDVSSGRRIPSTSCKFSVPKVERTRHWHSPAADVDVCGNLALIEAMIRGLTDVLRSRNTKGTLRLSTIMGQINARHTGWGYSDLIKRPTYAWSTILNIIHFSARGSASVETKTPKAEHRQMGVTMGNPGRGIKFTVDEIVQSSCSGTVGQSSVAVQQYQGTSSPRHELSSHCN
ncbi:hypothetical protein EDB87DRAFT_1580962 [Lactarius vividus]|nr:hypothetical protein EDB87DRAFT_1580962 [Lactarius vividus]